MLQHRAGCQGEYHSFNFRPTIFRLHQPREHWLTVTLQTHLRSSRWLTMSFLPPTIKIKRFYLFRAFLSHSLELANLNYKRGPLFASIWGFWKVIFHSFLFCFPYSFMLEAPEFFVKKTWWFWIMFKIKFLLYLWQSVFLKLITKIDSRDIHSHVLTSMRDTVCCWHIELCILVWLLFYCYPISLCRRREMRT